MNNKYYISLDFFRGFCGYGVALSHLYAFAFNSKIMEYTSILFVEFFFVLSGFVLYPQLIKTINNKKNLLIFYKRRWLRTLPLYFLLILLVSILTNNIFTKDFFKYLFLIQNIYSDLLQNDYYPIAWSLSVEEFFYLLFPIFLIFLKNKNYLKFTIIFFLIFSLIKFLFFSGLNFNFYRTGTILRLDAIIIGFLLAHYKNFILSKSKFIFTLLIIFLFFYYYKKNYFLLNTDSNLVKISFIIMLQIISSLALLSFLNLEKFFKNTKLNQFSLIISRQTYSIYLIHIIFIYILKNFNYGLLTSTIFYILLLTIFSSLIYEIIEKPILKIRPKLL